jgi:hypothetical protein
MNEYKNKEAGSSRLWDIFSVPLSRDTWTKAEKQASFSNLAPTFKGLSAPAKKGKMTLSPVYNKLHVWWRKQGTLT